MKVGSRVLFYYLMLMYGAQSLLSLLFPSYFDWDYKGYTEGLYWKTLLLIFIGALIFIGQSFVNGRLAARRAPTSSTSRLLSAISQTLRLPLAAIFLALSIPFGLEYGFSFFHSGFYMSDLPLWVVVLQAMKPIARLDLAYCTIKVLRGAKLSNVDILATSLYTLGGIASLTGAIDIVFLTLGFLLIYRRGALVMRAVLNIKGQSRRSIRWIVYSLLLASLPAAAIIGFANKVGFDKTFDDVSSSSGFVDSFAIPLALRVSSSHGSFIANAELPLSITEQLESVNYPIHNLMWRSCILFIQSGCPYRDDITHIARLNYVRTFWNQDPLKAGATPGLLASAVYIPFLPFSIIMLAFYCSLFTGSIDRALGSEKLSFLGIMVLVLFTYPVFENPIDLIVIFDPAFVYTVGIYFVLRSFPPLAVSSSVPKRSPQLARSVADSLSAYRR